MTQRDIDRVRGIVRGAKSLWRKEGRSSCSTHTLLCTEDQSHSRAFQERSLGTLI